MSLILYLQCFAVAFLGMVLQTTLKLRSIQQKAKVANLPFSALGYFKEDWLSVTSSLITIVLFLFFMDEIVGINKNVIDYLKIGFGFVGYTGSDIASRLFGLASKRINNIIDYKTNVADGIEPPK
ncbi:MAG: hypothetical protein AAB638_00730 [Patescibacteria group bacterium]